MTNRDHNPTLSAYPQAGRDQFDELMHSKKFLKKAGAIVSRQGDLYVYQDGAFRPAIEENFHPMAMAILPERLRTFKNAQAVLKSAMAQTQMQHDERLPGAIKFAADDKGVLVNVANGVLHVTGDAVRLLPHSASYRFTGKLAASWNGEWAEGETLLFNEVVFAALPENGDRVLLQWFAAYLLYPSCKHEVFLVS